MYLISVPQRSLLAALVLGLLLQGSHSTAFGQATQQSIIGLVTDATGGMISGATIKATNIVTGVEYTVQTNATGNYTVLPVPVGNFNVTCQLEGFESDMVSNQRVETAAQLRINFTMRVGSVTETIEVSAAAVALSTENAVVAVPRKSTVKPGARAFRASGTKARFGQRGKYV